MRSSPLRMGRTEGTPGTQTEEFRERGVKGSSARSGPGLYDAAGRSKTQCGIRAAIAPTRPAILSG